jgi:hypothetical protein
MNKILDPVEPVEQQGNDKSDLVRGVLVGTAVAVAFGVGGFFLVNDRTGGMGMVLFFLLPLATGFAVAMTVEGKKIVTASLLVGAIICTVVLLLTRMEGWVCVLMSTPLIAIGLAAGALVGVVARDIFQSSSNRHYTSVLILAAFPFLLMGANKAEEESRRTPRAETIANTLVVDAPREVVWEQLKTFDQIKGSKGLLMRIGLPVPVSCTMSGEGIGATRTCYFEEGHIAEKVTEWNPPSSMKLEITEFDVPGRPWLSFQDASYELTQDGARTTITRKTTIVSRLSPVWYWRRMEKIGVETEHEYLFEEVKRKVEAAK